MDDKERIDGQPEAASPDRDAAVEPTPPLVLLLDDNLMSASRVAAQLQQMHYRVRTLRGLPEATTMESMEPEMILINLGSRTLDGVRLIGPCRERFAGAVVVGFCGHLEIEIRRAAKAAGINRLLTNDQALSQLQQTL